MIKSSITSQRLIAAFLLGCLLFNYPMLSLFSGDGQVFGIPLLFAYLFATWALLIAAIAIIIEFSD